MKKLFALTTGLFVLLALSAQDAKEIVRKADEKFQGEKTSESVMTMKIVRPTWERTISLKSWTSGKDLALTLITDPAKEKGQTFLKRENEMWSWNPTIQRMIKLPPSMMSQGWMGSDYTNDDILRESSIVKDYSHSIIGSETLEGKDCYKIELIPHEDAAVVWGKIFMWISKEEFLQLKVEYYDEDEYLVRTMLGKDIKNFDGRTLPSIMEILPADKEGNKTIVTVDDMKFNKPIPASFFSQQNMKQVR